MQPRDEDFVVDSWADSWNFAHAAGVLPIQVYHREHRTYFTYIVNRQAKVLVAVNPTETDPRYEIYGYLVYEDYDLGPIVHFAYTKEWCRKMRVLSHLLYAAGIDPRRQTVFVSCWTKHAAQISNRTSWLLRRDPRFLRSDEWKDKYRENQQSRSSRPSGTASRNGGRATECIPQEVTYRRGHRPTEGDQDADADAGTPHRGDLE